MSGLRQATSGDSPPITAPSRLTLKTKPGDPEPRWQALGKMNLTKGALLKVVVTKDVPKEEGPAPKNAKSKTEKRAKPPVAGTGALVALRRGDEPEQGSAARLDSRAHRDERADRRRPPDARPHQLARGGFSGARDRASLARQGRSSPRADAGRTRALADVSQDAAQPQDQRQARSRRLHDRKGRSRDVSRLHAQRQSLPAGKSMRPRARDSCVRTATGTTGE